MDKSFSGALPSRIESRRLAFLVMFILAFSVITVEYFENHKTNASTAENYGKRRIKPMTPQKLRYRYIDKFGNTVIDASRFQEARTFSEGLAVVTVDDMQGYIDKRGELVIPTRFGSVGDFSEGLAAAAEISEYGYIDKKGDWQIKPKYDYAELFSEGLAIVFTRNRYSYIDGSGQTILNPRSSPEGISVASSNFSEGLAKILVGERLGFMDKLGKIVIAAQFTGAGKFSEGLARVEVDGKLGYIDLDGRFVIKPSFNTDADFGRNSTDFSEGWASLTEGLKPSQIDGENRWVYIDRTGKVVLQTNYFYAGSFKEGLAVVYDHKARKYGFINKSGKVVIPIVYDRASEFSEGLACVAIAN